MFVRLVCATCSADGAKERTLTRVDVETSRPLTSTTVEILGDDRQFHDDRTARFAADARPHQLARLNDDDTAWVVDCTARNGCGSRYEVTDDELRRAAELGRDRDEHDVYVPDEVGGRCE